MALAISNYVADNVKNSIFRNVAMVNPTNLVFKLSTTQVSADGTGRTELADGWYSSVTQARNGTNFAASSGGSGGSNSNSLSHGTKNTAQATYYLYVDDSAGNLWFFDNGAGDAGYTVPDGNEVLYDIGDFTVDMDAFTQSTTGTVSNYLVDAVINNLLRNDAWSADFDAIEFGFSQNATQPTAAGANITEPSGTWYSRQTISTVGGTNFTTPSAGSDTNNVNQIDWNSGNPVDENTTLYWLLLYDGAVSPNFLLAAQIGAGSGIGVSNGVSRVRIPADPNGYSFDLN